jgi:hypothetical protein
VLAAALLPPGGLQCGAGEKPLAEGDDLLSGEDSQQPDESDEWGRRRTYAEQAVDHADRRPAPSERR